MKNFLLAIIFIALVVTGAYFVREPRPPIKDYKHVPYSIQSVPHDIPDTLFNGSPIQWDATWSDAHKRGDVKVIWVDDTDTTKGALALLQYIEEVKPWMRSQK